MSRLTTNQRIQSHPRRVSSGSARVLIAITLLTSGVSNSSWAAEQDPCANATTTVQIDACLKERLDRADQELNATYQKVLARLSQPDAMGRPQTQQKRLLVEAQRHWVKFRDANCRAVWLLHADGTIRTSMNLGCQEELTTQREAQLSKWFLPRN